MNFNYLLDIMGAIILKTKNEIQNIDSINGSDGYAYAYLTHFSSLNYGYTYKVCARVNRDDGEGNMVQSDLVLDAQSRNMNKDSVQVLFDALGVEIRTGDNYDQKNRSIIASAFLIEIGSRNYFGISQEGWEIFQS